MQDNNKELIKTKYGHLSLKVLPGLFKYVLFSSPDSFSEAAEIVKKATGTQPYFLFDTPDDKSMIVSNSIAIKADKEQTNWKALRVIGEMPFGTVQGLLATISDCLKRNQIGCCVVSTYLTDYFFILEKNLEETVTALKNDGWKFV